MLDRWEYMISWALNKLCNYRCEYCFNSEKSRSREHPDCGKHSPQHISSCFDDTGKIWRIHMSGGEPFLYPVFIELCTAFTKTHYISINTNLSTHNVYDFAEIVLPEKVVIINAAFHVMEIEKRNEGKREFIKKVHHLQDKGFNVRVEYVVYPPLFPRLAKDVEYLKTQGVKMVNLKIFRGFYRGKEYPESYTNEERALINKYTLDKHEKIILENRMSFFGRPCSAGKESFTMDISGNLARCSTSFKRYGNLFEGAYHFDQVPKPCPFLRCRCPYEGITQVKKGRYSKLSTFVEVRQELLLRQERTDSSLKRLIGIQEKQ